MSLDALKRMATRAIDEIPRSLRIQKIPDILPDTTGKNEFKLAISGYCQADTYSCGAIAGWSVLEHFNPKVKFRAFYDACAPAPDSGTSTTRLMKALRKHGVAVSDRKDLDFDGIQQCLRDGKPILVSIAGNSLFDDEAGHWVAIYGFGRKPNRIFICGKTRPGFSRQEMTWKQFKAIWNPLGEGLVCSPKRIRESVTSLI